MPKHQQLGILGDYLGLLGTLLKDSGHMIEAKDWVDLIENAMSV